MNPKPGLLVSFHNGTYERVSRIETVDPSGTSFTIRDGETAVLQPEGVWALPGGWVAELHGESVPEVVMREAISRVRAQIQGLSGHDFWLNATGEFLLGLLEPLVILETPVEVLGRTLLGVATMERDRLLEWIEELPNEAKVRVSESVKRVVSDSILHTSIVVPLRALLNDLTER